MPTDKLPLSAHSSFRVNAIEYLSEIVETKLAAAIMKVSNTAPLTEARGNRLDLPQSVLWSCSYGLPICLRFPEGDYQRVQFRRKGSGATRIGTRSIVVNEQQSCVASGDSEVEFGDGYVQLAWRIPPSAIVRKLAALTGGPVTRRVTIDPVLDLATPQSQLMLQVLEALLGAANAGPSSAATLLRSELESALLVAFLGAARHNYRDLLDQGCPPAAPFQVHRAESFIESNWDKPITLEDIVSASGASARSVFRAFQQSRGYTPLQFKKRVRLGHAKRLLEGGKSTLSVTEIALMCGFSDLSRFSKEFSQAFGMPPSALMKRGNATATPHP